MAGIPDWIEGRIDSNPTKKLSQRHVVETMLEADRPFFSIRQLQSRLKPDIGPGTIRNRLDELCEIDVVAKEEYPDTLTLYYINHQESNWPIPTKVRRQLSEDGMNDFPTPQGLLTFQEPDAVQRLATGGWYMGFILVFTGVFLSGLEITVPIESSSKIITTAIILWIACILLMVAQSAITSVREYAV